MLFYLDLSVRNVRSERQVMANASAKEFIKVCYQTA
jgi:hypothetical protein